MTRRTAHVLGLTALFVLGPAAVAPVAIAVGPLVCVAFALVCFALAVVA